MLQTEYEGQAKRYMDVLDTTDAVVVAGGDGTLSEVQVLLPISARQQKLPEIVCVLNCCMANRPTEVCVSVNVLKNSLRVTNYKFGGHFRFPVWLQCWLFSRVVNSLCIVK